MLSSRECGLLAEPIKHQKEILTEEIDVSKTYMAVNGYYNNNGMWVLPVYKTYLQTALLDKQFGSLDIFLQCKNADLALNSLLHDKASQANYLEYLITSPESKEIGLNILVRCNYQNNMLTQFADKLNPDRKPVLDAELLKKYNDVLSIFLEKAHIKTLRGDWSENAGYQTPLEYAVKNNDAVAIRIILDSMSRANPYLEAIIKDDNENLTSLLKEVKPQDPLIQSQLQIAGIASVVLKKKMHFIPMLLDAGMLIYPKNLLYRQSLLHLLLSTLSKSKDLEIKKMITEMILHCLIAIQKGNLSKDVLQEVFNEKNLLELAFDVTPRNEELIEQLKKAGARLPQTGKPEESKAESNLLIESIKENNFSYFSSHI